MVSAFNPYHTLPVADEALDRGGVELLRAGLADKRLFVSLHRHALETPDRWGDVLAEITLNLAALYAANGDHTEDAVIAAVAAGYRDALRNYVASSAAKPKAPAKGKARTSAKTPAKPLTKAKAAAPAKLKARAKPASKPAKPAARLAGKATAGRKGARKP
jgi:Domain of unknown function (DUF5076)